MRGHGRGQGEGGGKGSRLLSSQPGQLQPGHSHRGLAPEIESLQDRSFFEIPLLIAFFDPLTGDVPKITPR